MNDKIVDPINYAVATNYSGVAPGNNIVAPGYSIDAQGNDYIPCKNEFGVPGNQMSTRNCNTPAPNYPVAVKSNETAVTTKQIQRQKH